MTEWISLEDKEPLNPGKVLILLSDGEVEVSFYIPYGIFECTPRKSMKHRITHWAPIPEPPKKNPLDELTKQAEEMGMYNTFIFGDVVENLETKKLGVLLDIVPDSEGKYKVFVPEDAFVWHLERRYFKLVPNKIAVAPALLKSLNGDSYSISEALFKSKEESQLKLEHLFSDNAQIVYKWPATPTSWVIADKE